MTTMLPELMVSNSGLETLTFHVDFERPRRDGKISRNLRVDICGWFGNRLLIEFHSDEGLQFSALFPEFAVFIAGERPL